MKQIKQIKRMKRIGCLLLAALAAAGLAAGCGRKQGADNRQEEAEAAESTESTEGAGSTEAAGTAGSTENAENGEEASQSGQKTGLAYETAQDGAIDFEALQKENPDIFAWLYVPGTGIDAPILQSPVSDDYYKSHLADGAEGAAGALYTEMPNMMDMCDFNTIIHGKDIDEADIFADLHKFEDPDFFGEHEQFYIYTPDNALTYEIFAAYYDGDSDILRRHDYTAYEGCLRYLEELYKARAMGKNQREEFEELTPYHFLVTLDGSIREEEKKQYVLIGVLVGDAAGKIDRVFLTE